MNELRNVRIVLSDRIIQGNIGIKDGKIESIEEIVSSENGTFVEEVYVLPGFIDEHIHGVNGADVMDATRDSLQNIALSLVKEGTTSFLATTMTQNQANIEKALVNVKLFMETQSQGAEILGIHLEGPFINHEAAGAQPKEWIMTPDVNSFREYQAISGNHIKMVTIAPEREQGQCLIRYCHSQGIVASIGHTKATYDDVALAIENGATNVTHCFNAMTPFHHRDIGVVGGALLHDELTAELIADGIHVHPKAIEILYKNKGQNITLVTDSIRAKGLPDGEYDLGGQTVHVQNNRALLNESTLAGSILKMNDAFRNMIQFTGLSLVEVSQMASGNPAKTLSVDANKGCIACGKDADLVVLNKNYEVLMTICHGTIQYKK